MMVLKDNGQAIWPCIYFYCLGLLLFYCILDNKGNEFARGLSSFSSQEINKIMGCHSNEIQKILGYVSKSEVVHKDDMVEI